MVSIQSAYEMAYVFMSWTLFLRLLWNFRYLGDILKKLGEWGQQNVTVMPMESMTLW